jgi:hypothetical protein
MTGKHILKDNKKKEKKEKKVPDWIIYIREFMKIKPIQLTNNYVHHQIQSLSFNFVQSVVLGGPCLE